MRCLELVITFLLIALAEASNVPFKLKYEWKSIDFKWKTSKDREKAINDRTYVKENVVINGMRVWKDRIFLATPRLKAGVPATISTIPLDAKTTSPKLEPFPNWDRQSPATDCSSFIFVEGIEIDTEGRIWMLDTGRTQTNFNETVPSKCPPKLVIIDLNKIEFGGSNLGKSYVVRTYNFPAEVAAPTKNYLNDLVLDNTNGWYAYITDVSTKEPGIVVYSFKDNNSWKIFDQKSMKGDLKTDTIDGEKLDVAAGTVNGIALSPVAKERTLYFGNMRSFSLYAISTQHLMKPEKNIGENIKNVGPKKSLSEGMVCDNKFNLYFGLLEKNAVARWNTKKSTLKDNQEVLDKNDETLEWPAKLTIHNGYLYLLSNKLQRFFIDMNFKEVNFGIFFAKINSNSYMHPPSK